jgi:hypothetical protein
MSRTGCRNTSALALCCLLTCTACSSLSAPPNVDNRVASGYTGHALTHLRQSLNAGNCDAIYAEASDEFHGLESHDQWLRMCQDLRSTLGLWTDFTLAEANAQGPLVHGNGTAIFSTVLCSFHLTWRVNGAKAELFSLHLHGIDQDFFAPQVPQHPQPLMDTPPNSHFAVDTRTKHGIFP